MDEDADWSGIKAARQRRCDQIQAERRSPEQNKAIIEIIQAEPDGMRKGWAYASIDYRGEPVEVQCLTPDQTKKWLVRADGHVTLLTPAQQED